MTDQENNFFVEHAFFFLANADKIAADKKMSLARVPETNGLAYTGTSGFGSPTLGVYLEWWLGTPDTMIVKDGEKRLICEFAGSALSGMNSCKTVNQQGTIDSYRASRFYNIWRNFMAVNGSFSEMKRTVVPYTVEEVYEMLGGAEAEADSHMPLIIDNIFLQSKIMDLEMKLEKTSAELSSTKEDLVRARISANEPALREIYLEYRQRESDNNLRIAELLEERRNLRKKLRSGIIDNRQYEWEFKPIKKELDSLRSFWSFSDIEDRIKQFGLSLQSVIDHFDPPQPQEKEEPQS